VSFRYPLSSLKGLVAGDTTPTCEEVGFSPCHSVTPFLIERLSSGMTQPQLVAEVGFPQGCLISSLNASKNPKKVFPFFLY